MKLELKKVYDAIVNEDLKLLRLRRSVNRLGVKIPNKSHVVFLTVGDFKTQAYVVKGRGRNIRNALKDAVQNYIKFKPNKHKPKQLQINFLEKYELIKQEDAQFNMRKDRIEIDYGLEGIAFGDDFHTVFLPSEVAGYQVVNKRRLHIRNSFRALHKHLPTTFSNFTKPLDKREATIAYRIRTQTYYIDKSNFYELYRNHRIYSELTKEKLWSAIKLTKDHYFKNVVNRKGKFIYSYLPYINKRERRYNILRHSGTIYSMIEVYELMPDKKLLEEAKRAFKYLLRSIKPFTVNGKEVKVVVERDIHKVGGNALAIVALAKYTQVTGDKQYIPLMQELAAWFKENQGEQGEFTIHKQQYSTGKPFEFISRFYPGEAILALIRLYQIDKDETWLDIAENAAHFLIEIRDKGDTVETITPDHWLLYGLNDLYRERQNEIYLKHSILISKAIIRKQITEESASRAELIGGYLTKSGSDPSSTPVACRSEGLSASYRLTKDFGYQDLAKEIKHAIGEGIKFQLQMHLKPESVMHYANKKLTTGAVQAGFRNRSLRNDFTQHSLSSFVAYYNILNDDK